MAKSTSSLSGEAPPRERHRQEGLHQSARQGHGESEFRAALPFPIYECVRQTLDAIFLEQNKRPKKC